MKYLKEEFASARSRLAAHCEDHDCFTVWIFDDIVVGYWFVVNEYGEIGPGVKIGRVVILSDQ